MLSKIKRDFVMFLVFRVFKLNSIILCLNAKKFLHQPPTLLKTGWQQTNCFQVLSQINHQQIKNFGCCCISHYFRSITKNKVLCLSHFGFAFSKYCKKVFWDSYSSRLHLWNVMKKKFCCTDSFKKLVIEWQKL